MCPCFILSVTIMAKTKKHKIKLKVIRIDKRGCHLSIVGKINGNKTHLILDTGASQTVFDKSRMITTLGHEEFEKVDSLSTGLGTNSMESHLVKILSLKIGEMELKNVKVVLLDLSHVNQSYEAMNMKPVDGVIGGDILKKYKGIIDYDKKQLTLHV